MLKEFVACLEPCLSLHLFQFDFILHSFEFLRQLLIVELRICKQKRRREPVHRFKADLDSRLKPRVKEALRRSGNAMRLEEAGLLQMKQIRCQAIVILFLWLRSEPSKNLNFLMLLAIIVQFQNIRLFGIDVHLISMTLGLIAISRQMGLGMKGKRMSQI